MFDRGIDIGIENRRGPGRGDQDRPKPANRFLSATTAPPLTPSCSTCVAGTTFQPPFADDLPVGFQSPARSAAKVCGERTGVFERVTAQMRIGVIAFAPTPLVRRIAHRRGRPAHEGTGRNKSQPSKRPRPFRAARRYRAEPSKFVVTLTSNLRYAKLRSPMPCSLHFGARIWRFVAAAASRCRAQGRLKRC